MTDRTPEPSPDRPGQHIADLAAAHAPSRWDRHSDDDAAGAIELIEHAARNGAFGQLTTEVCGWNVGDSVGAAILLTFTAHTASGQCHLAAPMTDFADLLCGQSDEEITTNLLAVVHDTLARATAEARAAFAG